MFNIKKISKNIFQISEPWYKEFANIYLFKNKNECLIIDSGLGLFNLKKFLVNLGYKKFIVALTHSHFDHSGGLKYFGKDKILISNKQYKNLSNNNIGLKYFSIDDIKKYKKEAKQINFLFNKNFAKFSRMNRIKFGSFDFLILNAPGHSSDSRIYYEKNNKILITGDLLYNGKTYDDLVDSNKKNFIKSLKKLKKIDYEQILPGHNEILNKTKADRIINNWISFLFK